MDYYNYLNADVFSTNASKYIYFRNCRQFLKVTLRTFFEYLFASFATVSFRDKVTVDS